MIRKIIKIDQEKCNGCSLCVDACHEGAIGMVNGKAKLLRDDYCDGLGDCLPACPVDAISFEEREAAAYDQEAVERNMQAKRQAAPSACAGIQARLLHTNKPALNNNAVAKDHTNESQLKQWPVQIKLVPINAPYFNNADLLIAADCTAYAFAGFHETFMKNKVTIIGCPKLDEGDYADKLTQILSNNEIKSITVVRMQVPCCGGIVNAVKSALKNSGKIIPWQIITISVDGQIVEN